MEAMPLWVVCDGHASGPFSFLQAWDAQVSLRPLAIDRCRDTAMVHAYTAQEALQAAQAGQWYPRID